MLRIKQDDLFPELDRDMSTPYFLKGSGKETYFELLMADLLDVKPSACVYAKRALLVSDLVVKNPFVS